MIIPVMIIPVRCAYTRFPNYVFAVVQLIRIYVTNLITDDQYDSWQPRSVVLK